MAGDVQLGDFDQSEGSIRPIRQRGSIDLSNSATGKRHDSQPSIEEWHSKHLSFLEARQDDAPGFDFDQPRPEDS